MSSLLEVSGVSVSFDGFRAINNLSFQIGSAELRAIIGPNGAGKTTFMDIVTGKTRPDEGRVLWGEKSVSLIRMSEAQIARAGIGRKFQRPTVFEDQSVFDNLAMALKNRRGPLSALFYKLGAADSEKVEGLAAEVGLKDSLKRKSGELSHGQKQWLEIGMLLVSQPRLMLIDEPVAGMTAQETEHTAELLTSLAGERTVIVVEHDMEFVRSIARTVTVLHQGSVLAEGTMDQVQDHPDVIEVYLGKEI